MPEYVTVYGYSHAIMTCGYCGVHFTVPSQAHSHAENNGGFFHCPNGHSWGFPKEGSETERLRRERDRLAQQIA